MTIGKINTKLFQTRISGVLKVLQCESMNAYEMGTKFGISHSTVLNYINYLTKNKLIYIEKYQAAESNRMVAYYKAGNKPSAKKIKFGELPKKKQPRIMLKMPRCDIAAAWMGNPIC